MRKRKPISFINTKRIAKRVDVSFRTSDGKKVSFLTTKRVPVNVDADFHYRRRGIKK